MRHKNEIRKLFLIFLIMQFTVKAYAEGLDKKEIFESILYNQSNMKRFSIKASYNTSTTIEREEGELSFLCDSFIDVDLERKTLHVRSNFKNFLTSGKEKSFPDAIPFREYYLSNDKLVVFNMAGHEYKWTKDNCTYSHFSEYVPTFWKMIELIRVGGFFNYKIKENLNPSLNDTMDYALAGADKLDPIFPSTFSILFTGFSYTVLNITETNFNGIPCYQLNVKVSEDDLKRYFSENNQAYVYKLPELIINVFASRKTYHFLALQYKLEAKFRGDFFGRESNAHNFDSGEFIYEYTMSPLELPPEVKNAEDCKEISTPK